MLLYNRKGIIISRSVYGKYCHMRGLQNRARIFHMLVPIGISAAHNRARHAGKGPHKCKNLPACRHAFPGIPIFTEAPANNKKRGLFSPLFWLIFPKMNFYIFHLLEAIFHYFLFYEYISKTRVFFFKLVIIGNKAVNNFSRITPYIALC